MDSKGIQKFREQQAKLTAIGSGRRFEPPKSHKAQKATPASTFSDGVEARRFEPPKSHKAQKATPASTFSDGVEAPALLKFSEDTASHQKILKIRTIRNSAAGLQAKAVIDLLQKTRQTFTAEQIYDACYVDINYNSSVLEILRNNPKVDYDGKHFKYKPKHILEGKDDLLSLIRKRSPDGLLVGDVEDAYFSVKEDIQTLKASGLVWLISTTDSKEEIVFFNDPKLNIKVDRDLKELFHSIDLPGDFLKIEGELMRNGMKPASNTALRRASGLQGIVSKPEHKSKKQRKISYKNITNTHLMGLFQ